MSLPSFGLGTYKLKGEVCTEIVGKALEIGYNLVDTARCYRNEENIGISLSKILSTTSRDKIFITSKVPPDEQGEEMAYASVCDSIKKLNVDYIDLMLIHWPGASKRSPTSSENKNLRHGTWRGLIKARNEGLLRFIGVSNFTVDHLKELIEIEGLEVPYVNQVEFHPVCQQRALVQYCSKHRIQLQAYSSLGSGASELVDHKVIVLIANKYNLTVSAVLLLWAMQQDISIIPKASSQTHLLDNYNVFIQYQNGFRLNAEDMSAIEELDKDHHFCWNPHTIL